jgi:polysaccharide export outer membrane protein
LFLVAGSTALAACAGPTAPALPPGPPAQAAPYHLQIGDQLAIRLFLTPELNEDVTVRPDGRITTQIAEGVPAAGQTPEQLAAALRGAYAGELKDPRITVAVTNYAPVRIYVAGEVANPGELLTQGPPPSLLQAVARAGGVRLTGDTARVFVIRRTASAQPAIFSTRYADALAGRDATADAALMPYDIVVVPKTGVARVYAWVNQHIQQFVPVNWGFSYSLTPAAGVARP